MQDRPASPKISFDSEVTQPTKSQIFYSDEHGAVEDRIKSFLNEQKDFLSGSTVKSPRAVGDAIQDILSASLQSILGEKLCAKYSSEFQRRAMADLEFEDCQGFRNVVDVKTHRLSTKFNMPNLVSVERLAKLYKDDKNYFVILMVSYDIDGLKAVIEQVRFVPIEFLGWDCLTVGALGTGQIQIKNSNKITVNPKYPRRQWMLELCDKMLKFYPKEIKKIGTRIERFNEIRSYWEKHA